LVLGSVMAATAVTPGLFIAGHVVQGLFTSMMLIAGAQDWWSGKALESSRSPRDPPAADNAC
jgi:hypothetical protein